MVGPIKIILHVVKSPQPAELEEMLSCFSLRRRTGMINDIENDKKVVN